MKNVKKMIFLFFLVVIFYFINNKKEYYPIDLSSKCVCSNDGMSVVDYKGPKAQIIWNNGTRSFYCEVREAFYEWVDPLKKKNIKYFYVQDFSYMKWGSYFSNWVLASNTFYVIDSKKYGAMGISYVPFVDVIYADLFVKKYGGINVHFNDITLDVLEKSNDLTQDRVINVCIN